MNHVLCHIYIATESAPAVPDYGFVSAILNAGIGEKIVMVILAIFSILSWAIIFYKCRIVSKAFKQSAIFTEVFWGTKRLDAVYQRAESLPTSPVAKIFRAGYVELSKIQKKTEADTKHTDTPLANIESIERCMHRAAATELGYLESLLSFLATTGSTAPFIGLLGTVIGIVGAFRDIGMAGNASLATVAPSIGGALVATAFGLFAAIPAVIAYNYFLARIRVLDINMQNFSADFLNIVKHHFF